MARTLLDKELSELDRQITHLGELVNDALALALEALETGDLAKSGRVIENDTIIDSLRAAVEEHTIRLLTLQQPLAGQDLRYLTATLSVAGELERIGDGAAGIAQIILRMVPLRGSTMPHVKLESASTNQNGEMEITEASITRSMLDLGYEAMRVLQGTMAAFKQRDSKAARYLWEEDDVVDVRYHLVRHDLMTLMSGARAVPALQNDSLVLQRATYLLWIGHKLERVADHCTNICERLVFVVDGETSIAATKEAEA